MPNIREAVGAGGKNTIHDVAMVQFMLKALKAPGGHAYFSGGYTNRFGPDTQSAIAAFQADHGLTRPGAGGPEIAGLLRPGSATWAALDAAFQSVDAQYRLARTTEGFGIVYVGMPDSRLAESVNGLRASSNLQPEFSQKVLQLMQLFFKQSGIAWSLVPRTGGWRTFAGQEGLTSDAGYGESIHQFGYAVDLTIANFTWFAPDLRSHKSPVQLSGMDQRSIAQLYAARDKIADALKLFRTTKSGDLAHLQNYDDDGLDSVSSLMALMHQVGPKKMRWQPQYRTPTNYLCDLGLGGDLYFVGTAIDIWQQDATKHVSPADLARALTAKLKADQKFSLDAYLGRASAPAPSGSDGDSKPSEIKAADIKPADIKAVQKILRAEFDAAAANWKLWTPVRYPTSERRRPNPVKR